MGIEVIGDQRVEFFHPVLFCRKIKIIISIDTFIEEQKLCGCIIALNVHYFCTMLTQDEQRFIEYWRINREKEKKTMRQLLIGLPAGLLFGVGIMAVFSAGWYQRANMVAYSSSSPYIFLVAIFVIIGFIAIFSKRHRWEMNEQQYQELLEKQKREAGHETNN